MKHFESIATPTDCAHFDETFSELCKKDYEFIKTITTDCERKQVSESQIKVALKHIHKGKSEDCFGLSVEKLFYTSDKLIDFLTMLVSQIFMQQKIPDSPKNSTITPNLQE